MEENRKEKIMDPQEQAETLVSRVFESMTIIIVVLLLAVCGLAGVAALTSQENGRLQGELSRVEAQLRTIRTK